jgi:hypothetical protein
MATATVKDRASKDEADIRALLGARADDDHKKGSDDDGTHCSFTSRAPRCTWLRRIDGRGVCT